MFRFMPDGRLKIDSAILDGGPPMTQQDARAALSSVGRVLLHSYPHTDDITADVARVRVLLEVVELSPGLEGHAARLYSGDGERVLVFEHSH